MQTSFVLSFMLLCTGCAEAFSDIPSGAVGGSGHAASSETLPAAPHLLERFVAAREPLAPHHHDRGADFVQCAACR
jgi:hypothetical protein